MRLLISLFVFLSSLTIHVLGWKGAMVRLGINVKDFVLVFAAGCGRHKRKFDNTDICRVCVIILIFLFVAFIVVNGRLRTTRMGWRLRVFRDLN